MSGEDIRIYRPAVRRAIGVLIMLAGGPGSGKTKSALRLATGLAEGGPIGFCDTENGRALYYADEFEFLHHELKEPFAPGRFKEQAIIAQKEGIKVWICDSFSHEHEGPGGVLAMAEAELQKLTKGDWSKRDQLKYTSWITPKMEHDSLMQRLWQLNCHLILCCRAKPKLELIKNDRGRTVPNPDKHDSPICAPDVPYAMTFSLMFDQKRPGVPTWLKAFDKIEPLIDWNAPIDEATGARIAAWARGDKPAAAEQSAAPAAQQSRRQQAPGDTGPDFDDPVIDPEQDATDIRNRDEAIRRFSATRTTKDHFAIVDSKACQDILAYYRKERREIFDAINAAIKASYARCTANEAGSDAGAKPEVEDGAASVAQSSDEPRPGGGADVSPGRLAEPSEDELLQQGGF